MKTRLTIVMVVVICCSIAAMSIGQWRDAQRGSEVVSDIQPIYPTEIANVLDLTEVNNSIKLVDYTPGLPTIYRYELRPRVGFEITATRSLPNEYVLPGGERKEIRVGESVISYVVSEMTAHVNWRSKITVTPLGYGIAYATFYLKGTVSEPSDLSIYLDIAKRLITENATPATSPPLTSPPLINVRVGDRTFPTKRGTTSWNYHVGVGGLSGFESDCISPDRMVENMRPVVARRSSTLTIESDPWPSGLGAELWIADGQTEPVEVLDGQFTLPQNKGRYVYVIHASWKGMDYQGGAWYTFVVDIR